MTHDTWHIKLVNTWHMTHETCQHMTHDTHPWSSNDRATACLSPGLARTPPSPSPAGTWSALGLESSWIKVFCEEPPCKCHLRLRRTFTFYNKTSCHVFSKESLKWYFVCHAWVPSRPLGLWKCWLMLASDLDWTPQISATLLHCPPSLLTQAGLKQSVEWLHCINSTRKTLFQS